MIDSRSHAPPLGPEDQGADFRGGFGWVYPAFSGDGKAPNPGEARFDNRHPIMGLFIQEEQRRRNAAF